MSAGERTGQRDLTYSRWHREDSLRRYLTRKQAFELGMVDVDGCEYCRYCRTPLALIETQVSDRDPKPATVTANLARMAGIDAYSVSVQVDGAGEITLFAVRRIEPPAERVQPMLPAVFAYWLYSLRELHDCTKRNQHNTRAS